MPNITGVNPPVLNDEDYVDKIYDSITAIDAHDHTSGKGVAITEAGQKAVVANASKFVERDVSGNVVSNVHTVPAGAVVGTTDTQALTNKTITIKDTNLTIQDDGDVTKQFKIQASGITTATTRTMTVPDADFTAVGVATAQTLTNKTLTTPVVDVASMTESATPANPASGTLKVYAKTDDKLYTLNSTGVETLVGSGAGGAKNYISANPDAESSTTGWATYKDAAQATPVDATGGSSTLTFTRSTSSPLRGVGSFLITTTAANLQGEGVSYQFNIDYADQAKVMTISFDYVLNSGTFADGDMAVYIYDLTNAVVIQPAAYTILNTVNANIPYKFIGTFQTSGVNAQYRLCFHRAVSTASAMTLKVDNVVLGPQTVQYGAPVTDPVAYTPTFTGFGTAAAVNVTSYRDGAYLVVDGTFTAGTATAVEAQMTLGFQGVSGNITTASTLPTLSAVGKMKGGTASATFFATATVTAEASKTYVTFSIDNSTVALAKSNGNAFTNSVTYSFNFKVQVAGWSSTVQMSSDTDTRVVAALISGDPASATSGNPIIVPTVGVDTHAAYSASTGRYTCPVPGIYKMYGAMQSASSATTLTIYKNAVSTALAGNLDSNGEATFVGAVNCLAGDIIDLRPGGTVDATAMTLNIERLSGPSAIAASESVVARYYNSAATTVTDSADRFMDFPSLLFDTHNAAAGAGGGFNATYTNTWRYLAPVPGYYEVDLWFIITTSSTASTRYRIYVTVDGTEDSSLVEDTNPDTATTKDYGYNARTVVKVNAGQAISIGVFKAGATMTLANNSTARNSRIIISKLNR